MTFYTFCCNTNYQKIATQKNIPATTSNTHHHNNIYRKIIKLQHQKYTKSPTNVKIVKNSHRLPLIPSSQPACTTNRMFISPGNVTAVQQWHTTCTIHRVIMGNFYRTQVYLGSDLWVRCVSNRGCWNFTDMTLADEGTNAILTDKGRVHKKKPEKMWSFAKLGGGGSRMVVKCQTSILEKYFFS